MRRTEQSCKNGEEKKQFKDYIMCRRVMLKMAIGDFNNNDGFGFVDSGNCNCEENN